MEIIKDKELLKKICTPVKTVEEANSILVELKKGIVEHNGIGLAAIQIGIYKTIAILRDPNGEFINIINPEILEKDGEFIFNGEGCLSLPGQFFKTKRFEHFVIKNNVIDGDKFREEKQYYYCDPLRINTNDRKGIDLEAIGCQHEMEHFLGLTIDRFKQISGTIIENVEKIGRNEPCPCRKVDINGNRIKFKKCCMKY